MDGDRLERQIGVVALAKQHSEGPLPLTAIPRRRGEPPAQEGERAFHLAAGAYGILDEIGVHAPRGQRPPDPVAPPRLELALVLGEQAGEPLVVKATLLDQRVDRTLHVLPAGAGAPEMRPHLRLRALPPVQVAVGGGERLLEIIGARFKVVGAGLEAQAALPSAGEPPFTA